MTSVNNISSSSIEIRQPVHNRFKIYTAKMRAEEMRRMAPLMAISIACLIATIALAVLAALGTMPLVFVPLVAVAVLALALCVALLGIKGSETKNQLYKKTHTVECNPERLRHKEIALFIEAKYDTNGVLKAGVPKRLCREYPVAACQVSSIEEIQNIFNQVKKLGSTIKVIWFSAHGNWDHLRLGKNKSALHIYNVENLRASFAQLAADANIVLAACSVAEGNNNIAKAIAYAAPGRKVFAPKRDLYRGHFSLKSIKPFRVQMTGPKWGWQNKNLGQKIAALFCLLMGSCLPSRAARHHFKENLLTAYQM